MFQDIPEAHMWLLLEYMYRGTINVEHRQLSEILKTASSLQIRGFTSQEPPGLDKSDTPRPLIVDEEFPPAKEANLQNMETDLTDSISRIRRNGGRKTESKKSSMPKKLKLIKENTRTSPDILKHTETESVSEDDQEIERIQPVDFSTNKIDLAKYSILGSYLKSGQVRPYSEEERKVEGLPNQEIGEDKLSGGLVKNLLARHEPRPTSRHSRGDSKGDQDISGEDNLIIDKDIPQINLPESMGIDIAERLRSHFLANIPAGSYNWLDGLNNIPPVSSTSLIMENVNLEKHPAGGIRTGEIGPNGKPAVKCGECGKTLADPSSLYRHRKIHSGDKPHKCPYCPRLSNFCKILTKLLIL